MKPSRMTFEQAAALPQAGQLAVQGLFAAGPLRSGEKILINGAGGGVGTIALQLAKRQNVAVTGVDSAVKFEMMGPCIRKPQANCPTDYAEREPGPVIPERAFRSRTADPP